MPCGALRGTSNLYEFSIDSHLLRSSMSSGVRMWGEFQQPVNAARQPDEDTQLFSAEKKLLQLYRYFDNHKIYLPSELCCSLEQLIKEVRMHVTTYAVNLDPDIGSTGKENRDARRAALEAIQGQVVVARTTLENEFRSLLGDAR